MSWLKFQCKIPLFSNEFISLLHLRANFWKKRHFYYINWFIILVEGGFIGFSTFSCQQLIFINSIVTDCFATYLAFVYFIYLIKKFLCYIYSVFFSVFEICFYIFLPIIVCLIVSILLFLYWHTHSNIFCSVECEWHTNSFPLLTVLSLAILLSSKEVSYLWILILWYLSWRKSVIVNRIKVLLNLINMISTAPSLANSFPTIVKYCGQNPII